MSYFMEALYKKTCENIELFQKKLESQLSIVKKMKFIIFPEMYSDILYII